MNACIASRHLVGQLAGAVGRVIVDDEYVRSPKLLMNLVNQGRQIVTLIVGGEGNEHTDLQGRRRHETSFPSIGACIRPVRGSILLLFPSSERARFGFQGPTRIPSWRP